MSNINNNNIINIKKKISNDIKDIIKDKEGKININNKNIINNELNNLPDDSIIYFNDIKKNNKELYNKILNKIIESYPNIQNKILDGTNILKTNTKDIVEIINSTKKTYDLFTDDNKKTNNKTAGKVGAVISTGVGGIGAIKTGKEIIEKVKKKSFSENLINFLYMFTFFAVIILISLLSIMFSVFVFYGGFIALFIAIYRNQDETGVRLAYISFRGFLLSWVYVLYYLFILVKNKYK
jgi:hypothetical protein